MFKAISRIFAPVVGCLLLAACTHAQPFAPGPHLTVLPTNELPPPAGVAKGAIEEYHVGPYDKLSVTVLGIPELTQKLQADAGAKLQLPLVGTVDASGLTLQQLSDEIAQRLRGRYVRNPQVAVNLEEAVSQTVTVDGQVKQPGAYPVVGRLTLMRSVALAQGTTEYAKLEDVVVFRTVGDQEMAALYNLGAIRRGVYPDPQIYPNDLVVVGDSPARRMFTQYLQAASVIVTPIITVLQRI